MSILSLTDTRTSYGKYACCFHNGYLISATFSSSYLYAGSVDGSGLYTNIATTPTAPILSLYSDGTYIYAGHWKTYPMISVWSFDGVTLTMIDSQSLTVDHEVRDFVKGSGTDFYFASFDSGTPNSGTVYKATFNGVTISIDFSYGSMSGRPYSIAWDSVNDYLFVGLPFEGLKAFSIGVASFTLLTTLTARDGVEGLAFYDGTLFAADLNDGLYAYTFNGSSFSLVDSLTTDPFYSSRRVIYDTTRNLIVHCADGISPYGNLNILNWDGSNFDLIESFSYSLYQIAVYSEFISASSLLDLKIFQYISPVIEQYSITSLENFGTPFVGSCGSVVGVDLFPHTTMYNGTGVVKDINSGGLEVHIEMDTMYNIIYPLYVSGGEFIVYDEDPSGIIIITALYQDSEEINLNSIFKDNGVTAKYYSSVTGYVDITSRVKRYGYINTYKAGYYYLTYEVTYRQVTESEVRIVKVIEPNWLERTMPDIYFQSDLVNQTINRLSDIYWELNYLSDNSRFNFDSRLQTYDKYTSDYTFPIASFDPSTDIQSNIISLTGYLFEKNDIIFFESDAGDLPTELGLTTDFASQNHSIGAQYKYDSIWWRALRASTDTEYVSPPSTGNDSWKYSTFIVANVLSEDNWEMSTVYAIGDYVNRFGKIWVCQQAHTSSLSNEPGSYDSYWLIGCRIQVGKLEAKGIVSTIELTPPIASTTCYIKQYKPRVDSQGFIFELLSYSGTISEPGIPKGYYNSETIYVKDDLVELNDNWYVALSDPIEVDPNYTWKKRVSTNIGKDPETETTYWELSKWKPIVPTTTSGKEQRIQTVDKQLTDNLIRSLGVPDWFYFELTSGPRSRIAIARVFQFLTTVRGIPLGFESMLNFVNMYATYSQKEPEWVVYPAGPGDVGYNDYITVKYNPIFYSRRGIWDSTISYNADDVVFKNVYSGSTYLGCNIYLSSLDSNLGNTPSDTVSTAQWQLLRTWRKQTGDNSYYDIEVNGFNFLSDITSCITDLDDQYKASKYLAEILKFMIPAYIRYDTNLYLCTEFYHTIAHSFETTTLFDMEEDTPPYTIYVSDYPGVFDDLSGTVTVGGAPPPKTDVVPNISIAIVATPEAGYYFVEWEILGIFGSDNYGAGMVNEWQPATAYVIGDFAWDKTVNAMYECTSNHTSVAGVYPSDSSNWVEGNITNASTNIIVTHGSVRLRAKFLAT